MDVKKILDDFDLTQVEFAKEIGVTPSSVSRWIGGDREPRAGIKARIERFVQKENEKVSIIRNLELLTELQKIQVELISLTQRVAAVILSIQRQIANK